MTGQGKGNQDWTLGNLHFLDFTEYFPEKQQNFYDK